MEEVKKKKKAYVKPEMHVEEFTPNEYIAVCWYVACSLGENNSYDGRGSSLQHTKQDGGRGCGWAKNQVIKGSNNNFTMQEENVPLSDTKTGTLACSNVVIHSYYDDGTTPKEISWETYSNGWYHHKGIAQYENESRPLHS